MGFIWTIIIGFIVGVLAKFLHPGRDNLGLIMTTILGIVGAMLAAFIGQAVGWYAPDESAGFIASVISAVVVLAIYTKLVIKK